MLSVTTTTLLSNRIYVMLTVADITLYVKEESKSCHVLVYILFVQLCLCNFSKATFSYV
jgi:hypothetical protein